MVRKSYILKNIFIITYSSTSIIILFVLGGTFSENFYDLTRVSYSTNSKPTNNQLYLGLALVVCIPYLRNKCDIYIDQLQIKYKLQLKEVIQYNYVFIYN